MYKKKPLPLRYRCSSGDDFSPLSIENPKKSVHNSFAPPLEWNGCSFFEGFPPHPDNKTILDGDSLGIICYIPSQLEEHAVFYPFGKCEYCLGADESVIKSDLDVWGKIYRNSLQLEKKDLPTGGQLIVNFRITWEKPDDRT